MDEFINPIAVNNTMAVDPTSAPQTICHVLHFNRTNDQGVNLTVKIDIGVGNNLTMASTVRDAMVLAKQIRESVFKSTAKAILLETVYDHKTERFGVTIKDTLTLGIEAARVYSLGDTFERFAVVENQTNKVVRFQVYDELESDDQESDSS